MKGEQRTEDGSRRSPVGGRRRGRRQGDLRKAEKLKSEWGQKAETKAWNLKGRRRGETPSGKPAAKERKWLLPKVVRGKPGAVDNGFQSPDWNRLAFMRSERRCAGRCSRVNKPGRLAPGSVIGTNDVLRRRNRCGLAGARPSTSRAKARSQTIGAWHGKTTTSR